MNKFTYAVATLMLTLGMFTTGCSQSPTQQAVSSMSQDKSEAAPAQLNIRYVDMDSIAANYNLARDLQEAQLRAYSRLNAAQQQKSGEIQKAAGEIQQKLNNNGYLSEVSYNSDMQRVNKMQQEAEGYLNNLQRSQEQELAQLAMQMQDSINSFIKDYNATRGYDAILIKSSGLYFNPDLDITDEIIAGLNARYTKVAK
ncbi:MAG: OmpH family outer membrane protein [Muribaculaceae bacterium]|nr:OmpH family outer membrane protein [Muribaculaceae bacterium]